MRTKKAESKKPLIFCICLLLVIIVILLVFILAEVSKNEETKKNTEQKEKQTTERPMIVNKDNVDEIIGELEDNSADTQFNCRMSSTWTFEDGKAESQDAYVANTTYNHYMIYFDVQLNETEEIIYSSPYMPVGTEMYGVTLDKDLEAGDYEATVIYHLVDDNKQEVSSVGFTINIQVLN